MLRCVCPSYESWRKPNIHLVCACVRHLYLPIIPLMYSISRPGNIPRLWFALYTDKSLPAHQPTSDRNPKCTWTRNIPMKFYKLVTHGGVDRSNTTKISLYYIIFLLRSVSSFFIKIQNKMIPCTWDMGTWIHVYISWWIRFTQFFGLDIWAGVLSPFLAKYSTLCIYTTSI